MIKDSLCWTCSKCMTIECPKHENSKIEKQMWRTQIYECDKYDYDGECLHCKLNTKHQKGNLYATCSHFIKGCEGYCSQTNYMRGNYELEGDNIG